MRNLVVWVAKKVPVGRRATLSRSPGFCHWGQSYCSNSDIVTLRNELENIQELEVNFHFKILFSDDLYTRKIFFSPIDYPTHYDSVFLPDSFKNKFIQRFEGFDKEVLSKFPKVHNHVLEDIMRKLKTVYDRSITKQFNFEEMAKCKSVTDKLDLLRDEKFKHVFGFDSTEFVINRTKVI